MPEPESETGEPAEPKAGTTPPSHGPDDGARTVIAPAGRVPAGPSDSPASDDGTRIADDSHEATVIEFAKDGVSTTTTITWDTSGAEPGEYVIRYRASSRGIGGNLTPFEGEASVTVG